jgi:hypothetical protein
MKGVRAIVGIGAIAVLLASSSYAQMCPVPCATTTNVNAPTILFNVTNAGTGTVVSAKNSGPYAIYGESSLATQNLFNAGAGVYGINVAVNGTGVKGVGKGIGVRGSAAQFGVYGDTEAGIGVKGLSVSGSGVAGESTTAPGVNGISQHVGVKGVSGGSFNDSYGVAGDGKYGVVGTGNSSGNSSGVYGLSSNGFAGVEAHGEKSAFGLFAFTSGNADAVHAETQGSTSAIYGKTTGVGYAGFFEGRVHVAGALTKASGSFLIDHPLDPANKYLAHSFVESPDMLNIYSGTIRTDIHGAATVTMPNYFDALNRDFRYQLTVIGEFAQAIIGEEINGNQFTIRTSKPNVKVSWQVTGVRKDAWAKAHPVIVEENKSAEERGLYLHPELYGEPAEKSLLAARRPGARQVPSDR